MKPITLSRSGLPIDAADWTVEDWRDLHQAIETAKAKIINRHKSPCQLNQKTDTVTRQTGTRSAKPS